MKIKIGTSGWTYPHWQGIFYPEDLSQSKWLNYYCRYFDTVELNASFYHLPQKKAFINWGLKTPENFCWSVKASRYITHIKKFLSPKESLKKLFQAVIGLEDKLGPILFQLPPSLKYNSERFEKFLKVLPKDYLYTLEPRHPSWICDELKNQLTKYNIAFCIADTAGRFPTAEFVTTNFIYIRLHGSKQLYSSNYSLKELKNWAKKIKSWKKDIFIYFDNDAKGFAVKNALQLKKLLN